MALEKEKWKGNHDINGSSVHVTLSPITLAMTLTVTVTLTLILARVTKEKYGINVSYFHD